MNRCVAAHGRLREDPKLVTANDAAIHCRGGNVTITGLKFGAGEGATVSDGPGGAGGSSSPAPVTLKQRTAAFNGTLGFFTIGLSIEVLGQFQLKR